MGHIKAIPNFVRLHQIMILTNPFIQANDNLHTFINLLPESIPLAETFMVVFSTRREGILSELNFLNNSPGRVLQLQTQLNRLSLQLTNGRKIINILREANSIIQEMNLNSLFIIGY